MWINYQRQKKKEKNVLGEKCLLIKVGTSSSQYILIGFNIRQSILMGNCKKRFMLLTNLSVFEHVSFILTNFLGYESFANSVKLKSHKRLLLTYTFDKQFYINDFWRKLYVWYSFMKQRKNPEWLETVPRCPAPSLSLLQWTRWYLQYY